MKMIGTKLGKHFTQEDMTDFGLKGLKAEREFNRKAGFTHKDDRLTKFFYEEPLPPHNKTVAVRDEDMDRPLIFDTSLVEGQNQVFRSAGPSI